RGEGAGIFNERGLRPPDLHYKNLSPALPLEKGGSPAPIPEGEGKEEIIVVDFSPPVAKGVARSAGGLFLPSPYPSPGGSREKRKQKTSAITLRRLRAAPSCDSLKDLRFFAVPGTN